MNALYEHIEREGDLCRQKWMFIDGVMQNYFTSELQEFGRIPWECQWSLCFEVVLQAGNTHKPQVSLIEL